VEATELVNPRPILAIDVTPRVTDETGWNAWYDEVHVPELQGLVDGVLQSDRFRVEAGSTGGRYVTLHQFESRAHLLSYFDSPLLASRSQDYEELWGKPEFFVKRALIPIFSRLNPNAQR
jgi:hypothetical protein